MLEEEQAAAKEVSTAWQGSVCGYGRANMDSTSVFILNIYKWTS